MEGGHCAEARGKREDEDDEAIDYASPVAQGREIKDVGETGRNCCWRNRLAFLLGEKSAAFAPPKRRLCAAKAPPFCPHCAPFLPPF